MLPGLLKILPAASLLLCFCCCRRTSSRCDAPYEPAHTGSRCINSSNACSSAVQQQCNAAVHAAAACCVQLPLVSASLEQLRVPAGKRHPLMMQRWEVCCMTAAGPATEMSPVQHLAAAAAAAIPAGIAQMSSIPTAGPHHLVSKESSLGHAEGRKHVG
jgi:hypothetical protein